MILNIWQITNKSTIHSKNKNLQGFGNPEGLRKLLTKSLITDYKNCGGAGSRTPVRNGISFKPLHV